MSTDLKICDKPQLTSVYKAFNLNNSGSPAFPKSQVETQVIMNNNIHRLWCTIGFIGILLFASQLNFLFVSDCIATLHTGVSPDGFMVSWGRESGK